jgi:hypothetical protein
MENFILSSQDDLNFTHELTTIDKLESLSYGVEIENFKDNTNAQFTNYFQSTNINTEFFPVSEFEGVDEFSMTSINVFKKSKKLTKNQTDQIFYILKIHRKKCRHKVKKLERNRVKNCLEEDFENFIQDTSKTTNLNNLKYEKNNLNNIKSKNRSFRLFDKDVIIKKIMTNFLKFLRKMLELRYKSEVKEIQKLKFYSLEQCKKFLRLNTVSQVYTIINCKTEHEYLYSKQLIKVFEENFINSKYFVEYLIEKIKLKFDEEYTCCFLQYIKRIIAL